MSLELKEQPTIEESIEIKNLSNPLIHVVLVDFIYLDVLMDAKDNAKLFNLILFNQHY